MAYLFTHHDPHHAHAIVGALVLVQFAWRWWWLIAHGSMWQLHEPVVVRIATVALHAALPLLSFQLPLPTRRNMSAPMIWPEFRYHSALFSARHVLSCALVHLIPTPHARVVMQLLLAHATMRAASIVTAVMGDVHSRTTNAMPYPPAMSSLDVRLTKEFYTYAQMFATAMSISGDADLAYMPLLAIQLAPFMMTLVRKHLVGATTYHIVYACALAAPLLGQLMVSSTRLHAAWFAMVCGFVARQLRVRYGYGKHVTWSIAPVVGWAVTGRVEHHHETAALVVTSAYMATLVISRLRALVVAAWSKNA